MSAAYYRGAMGILLVYDVTDESSFNNIRNWMRNIEQNASDNVNKVSSSVELKYADQRLTWPVWLRVRGTDQLRTRTNHE